MLSSILLFSTAAMAQSCGFQSCPNGQAFQNSNPITTNGCGTPGLTLPVDPFGYTSCCNGHDVCYQQCGKSKEQCDREFMGCMMGICKGDQLCVGGANAMFNAVAAAGCPAYTSSQQSICSCK